MVMLADLVSAGGGSATMMDWLEDDGVGVWQFNEYWNAVTADASEEVLSVWSVSLVEIVSINSLLEGWSLQSGSTTNEGLECAVLIVAEQAFGTSAVGVGGSWGSTVLLTPSINGSAGISCTLSVDTDTAGTATA